MSEQIIEISPLSATFLVEVLDKASRLVEALQPLVLNELKSDNPILVEVIGLHAALEAVQPLTKELTALAAQPQPRQ